MEKGYEIKHITKSDCKCLLERFHYLSKQGFSFRGGFNYGLFSEHGLIGVVIFTSPSVPETVKGAFCLDRTEQHGIFELSRLAIDPTHYEQNLTSWFLSRCIKLLRHETTVKAILTYADSDFHNGYIYQATNFKYYGLTSPKKDFWILQEDGSYKKHQRGKVKGLNGEWRDRSRKHRYLMIFDKSMVCNWEEKEFPKNNNKSGYNK